MEKNTVLVIIVAALVIIAGIQAVELGVLKSKIESGKLSYGAKTASVSAQTGGASVGAGTSATSLDDLSGMVGGC